MIGFAFGVEIERLDWRPGRWMDYERDFTYDF